MAYENELLQRGQGIAQLVAALAQHNGRIEEHYALVRPHHRVVRLHQSAANTAIGIFDKLHRSMDPHQAEGAAWAAEFEDVSAPRARRAVEAVCPQRASSADNVSSCW